MLLLYYHIGTERLWFIEYKCTVGIKYGPYLGWKMTLVCLFVCFFFLFFVSTIRDELYGPTGGMNVRNEFRTIIRGGEQVVQVQDDKSLMIMFRLNSNAKDDIVVQVVKIPTVPLQVMYEDEQEE